MFASRDIVILLPEKADLSRGKCGSGWPVLQTFSLPIAIRAKPKEPYLGLKPLWFLGALTRP
jgi:hypothetical protein